MMQAFRLATLFVASVTWTTAQADGYRLVPGDLLSLNYVTQGTEAEVSVDIDGELRLPGSGGVAVAGATLDEAEAKIVAAIDAAGVFLNPEVSLRVLTYAPVVVSGDVSAPGQYPYVPGMTVGSLLALSGGSQTAGVSRFEVERAQIDNAGFMRSLNLDMAGSVLRIARLQSLLDGEDSFVLPDALVSRIPSRATVPVERLAQAERALFDTTQKLITESLLSWDEEIRLIKDQLSLFEQRIKVQEDISASIAVELKNAQDLQKRGLQTAARLAAVTQRDADARARALELESARVAAVQALSSATRARSNFLRSKREDWLSALQRERLALEDSELNFARRAEQQAILTGDSSGAMMLAEVLDPSYRIVSPRVGRSGEMQQGLEAPVLPGEMLIVTLNVGEEGNAQDGAD